MKKYFYLIPVALILLIAIVLVFYTPENTAMKTNHFDNGEISFDYPENWQNVAVKESQVASFTDPKSKMDVTVNRQAMPNGYSPKDNFKLNFTEAQKVGFKLTSSENITISRMNAYENIYDVNLNNNSSIQDKEIWIENNGVLYSIICTTPKQKGINFNFNSALNNSKNDASLDVVKKSFEIKNSSVKNSTSPFWGHISIPSISANWGIRSDTVNAYNSTYHISGSFYPGRQWSLRYSGPSHHILSPFQ